jgi:hypothetical protein
MKKTALLSACLALALGAPFAAHAGKPGMNGTKSGRILLLHYKWRHDSLSLVDKEWVPAAVKPKRGRARGNPHTDPAGTEPPRTPFSYELVSAGGDPISVGYLRDPGLQTVEVQEKGEHQIQPHERMVDSADVFLRISEPEAKTIRFYRHARPGSTGLNPDAEGAAAKGAASGGSAKRAGPEPASAKTLLAEFPLD